MRHGLLASRTRLKCLNLQSINMSNEALNAPGHVYENNNGKRHINYALSELDLSHNLIEGWVGGNHLHRLLLTLHGLKKLKLTGNDLGQAGVRALFSEKTADAMSRLHSLCMSRCLIDNVCLAQMAASMPPDSTAISLVHLTLQCNNFEGLRGGKALCRLLSRCGRLETLLLYGNHSLGPTGARALAPALRNLVCLQELNLSVFPITPGAAEGIMDILTYLEYIRCLKSLNLKCNNLPPATLAALINYLNGTGRCLEVLRLYANRDLFGTTNGQHSLTPSPTTLLYNGLTYENVA